jgi:hypothetical protein
MTDVMTADVDTDPVTDDPNTPSAHADALDEQLVGRLVEQARASGLQVGCAATARRAAAGQPGWSWPGIIARKPRRSLDRGPRMSFAMTAGRDPGCAGQRARRDPAVIGGQGGWVPSGRVRALSLREGPDLSVFASRSRVGALL